MRGIHLLPTPAPAPWLGTARLGLGGAVWGWGLWGAAWPQDELPALHTGTRSLRWAVVCREQKRSTASPRQPPPAQGFVCWWGTMPGTGMGQDRPGALWAQLWLCRSDSGWWLCRLQTQRAAPRVLSQRSALGRLWHGSILPLCVGSEGSWAAAVSRNYARPFHHNRFAQNSCININVPKDFEQLFGISRTNI